MTKPTAGEISTLIAWLRRLPDTGPRQASPAELAAFQLAKAGLPARISHHSHATPCDQPGDIVD